MLPASVLVPLPAFLLIQENYNRLQVDETPANHVAEPTANHEAEKPANHKEHPANQEAKVDQAEEPTH